MRFIRRPTRSWPRRSNTTHRSRLNEAELGIRFYREMERLLRTVCADPQRFRKFDPPARRYFSAQFPYAVIFLEKPDHIWIVAVMHMKRRPGYWKARLG